MKQYITSDQFKELNKKKRYKLLEWYVLRYRDNFHGAPPITIGQMIEFLNNKYEFVYYFTSASNNKWIVQADPDDELSDPQPLIAVANTELCDALWSAVKESLK